MNIQPLPGYKKPANIDSIHRPKKRPIGETEEPTKPEPHSAELDAALDAVSQLNADLDNDKGVSKVQRTKPEPRRIDDVMSTQSATKAPSTPIVKPRLDDADMTANIKLEDGTKTAGQPVSPTDEASLAEIEKNIAKAVEDDLGIKRPTVQPVEPANNATLNSAQRDDSSKHDNSESTPTKQATPAVAPKPPKPRKMQSLFSVSDFAKPEPKFDGSNFSMDSNTMSDDDILTASIPSSASNGYASPASNAGTSIDGIRKSTSDAKRLDDRQNQLLSDMGYGSESNELPVRQERPISRSVVSPQPSATASGQATKSVPSANVSQAIQSISPAETNVNQAGFIVRKPKQRADFLAIIGIPFGLLAILMAVLPASVILSMKIVGVALLTSLPVMALIGLVFGVIALIKDVKQTEPINKIIAGVSIVLAIASIGILYVRSDAIVKDFGTEITKTIITSMQGDSSSSSSSDSSSSLSE